MEYIDIRVRYSTGAYHASVSGQKVTASSSISERDASKALLCKLQPDAELERIELLSVGHFGSATCIRLHLKCREQEMKITAYCFASGHIEFGSTVPDGAIALAIGEDKTVREIISGTAQLSRQDNETWFVPGVAGAPNQREGILAMARYIQWLGKSNQPGFRALGA
ncbi:hypothetical protein [Pseudomonas sp. P9_31]|uniref:hypothetical protein n=1 Tax=Pseudomonas sp. P9_31 TaxID=3043448 RepID=UPI002A35F203|nr:hypothetical protein [Pseudomonas sp. P9_31]WPN56667.1 hypothetical protein QMK51_21365 [Pseudomonas sp. P9_31]